MLEEISSLLDAKRYNIVAIECKDLSSPAFLHLCIVDYAVKKNIKVVYLSAARSMLAFKVMASKVMVRFSEKLKFLPVSQFLPSGFIDDDGEAFFACILEEIERRIEETDKEMFIIFDNFSVFSNFANTVSHIPAFIRRLQQLNKGVEIKLVITILTRDQISNIILHESDMILRIKHIGNGFAKDVTGQLLVIERNGEAPYAENIFNYHLSDRSARLFLPGMSRPEL